MPETGFETTVKSTIERDIQEAFEAGDMNLVDQKLDIYPYGRERPYISLERAHELAYPMAKVAMNGA